MRPDKAPLWIASQHPLGIVASTGLDVMLRPIRWHAALANSEPSSRLIDRGSVKDH